MFSLKNILALEILSFGNELLIGRITNTNATWLASKFTQLGFAVTRITSLSDDLLDLKAGFTEALSRKASIIIATGGLGPTWDDRTLEGLSLAVNVPLETHQEALEMIIKRYEMIGAQIRESSRKMAKFPQGGIPLHNSVGTAPGLKLQVGSSTIFCVPGVPKEMQAIVEEQIIPSLNIEEHNKFFQEEFTIEGIGESSLAHITKQLTKEFPRIYIKSHPQQELSSNGIKSVITFHLTANGEEKLEIELKQVSQKLKTELQALGAKFR